MEPAGLEFFPLPVGTGVCGCLLLRPHMKKINKLMPTVFALKLPGKACPGGNMTRGLPYRQSQARRRGEMPARGGSSLGASKERELDFGVAGPSVLIPVLLLTQRVCLRVSLEGQSLCVSLWKMGTTAASSDL